MRSEFRERTLGVPLQSFVDGVGITCDQIVDFPVSGKSTSYVVAASSNSEYAYGDKKKINVLKLERNGFSPKVEYALVIAKEKNGIGLEGFSLFNNNRTKETMKINYRFIQSESARSPHPELFRDVGGFLVERVRRAGGNILATLETMQRMV
jgi:hypothetical protein